ncbi:MAG: peptide chain release factor 2 [Candidatus Eremiobacteraeota bacterium]|nr:peptide chain release factor 2 [Candidatus Eremiobacteraeota bacterium]
MNEQLKSDLSRIDDRLKTLQVRLDYAAKEREIAALETQSHAADFWNDPQNAQKHMKRLADLKAQVEPLRSLDQRARELGEYAALDDADDAFAAEVNGELERLRADLDAAETTAILDGEFDSHGAILTIHAGAGGTEACDWASMLLRMYLRWAERHGYRAEIVDSLEGEEAGIKSATVVIEGRNAYGYLESERGVHRLVRISPFDAAKRRHTSFASVDVTPDVEEGDEAIEIRQDELEVETYKSGGAGGQYVNKTESAIRITHKPTGIIVAVQNERSQLANRNRAMKMLAAKLAQRRREEQAAKLAQLTGKKSAIEWGSQIRSYTLQPYTMVNDHRTEIKISDAQRVLDGDLDQFMLAYLQSRRAA